MKLNQTNDKENSHRTYVEGTAPYYDTAACGKRIQQLRKASGYTQEALADCLGIDRSFLSRIEAGKKGCSVDMFITLASVFGTSLDHLILGKSPEHGPLKEEIRDLIQRLATLEERL